MRFVSVRDLRSKSAEIWRRLSEDRDLVITSNGKPIAIISATDEEHLEESLRQRRQARAAHAVKQLQERSVEKGLCGLSPRDVEAEVGAARKNRRR